MPSQRKIDRTLGGRLDPAPEEMFQTEKGAAYWDRVNNFINYMDSILPSGYRLSSPSGYRPETKSKSGKKIGIGSHKRPAFDFVVVSESSESPWSSAGEKERWAFYENTMQPLAQYFGMEALGAPHGTGPHLHTQSNKTSRPLKPVGEDPEVLEQYRRQILAALGLDDGQEVAQYKRGGKVRDAYGRSLI
jgi:hypothetical protein